MILNAGDRSRQQPLPPGMKGTTTLRLEADLRLDEEASEEATSTFLEPTLHARIDEHPLNPSRRRRRTGVPRSAGDSTNSKETPKENLRLDSSRLNL